jgi:hypothetical protein
VKNGVVFYTSTVQAAAGLRLHAVLFNANAAVSGIGFGGIATAPATAPTPAPANPPSNVFRRARPRDAGTSPVRRR